MWAVDEITKRYVNANAAYNVIVSIIDSTIIRGYTAEENEVASILIYSPQLKHFVRDYIILKNFKDELVFSKYHGFYMLPNGAPEYEVLKETELRGLGNYPYNTISKHYEACESFDIFEGKQVILDKSTKYKLADHFDYTFGLEFETSQGYVPEDICFRDGLIPLRDGSISGIEYSTVVLQGNDGISLLKQQLDTLKEYTYFNKECSLHVHIGGFPLDTEKLFRLYYLCKKLEPQIETMVPNYTFYTSKYKASGKDYCKKLQNYRNFNQLYSGLTGRNFMGDFTQPHPNDIRREAKWRIGTRYTWLNLINALCYKVNKTVEFRFLRPTYNFKKIVLWLYIFNAILKYAEKYELGKNYNKEDLLSAVLEDCYSDKLLDNLKTGADLLTISNTNQQQNGDYIGQDINMEDNIFDKYLDI